MSKVSAAVAVSLAWQLEKIERWRDETWRWERLVHGRKRTPYRSTAARSPSLPYRRWVHKLWRQRARKARRYAFNPPHEREWLCIHSGEGSWNANTGNGYYGGLQMDMTFQRTYGPELLRRKGTANNWTPFEQMWVAERAYRSGRGFYPWPNTARRCGLI